MLKREVFDISLWHGFTPQQLDLLYGIMQKCHFTKGMVIFNQGEVAEYLYILLTGEVVIQYKPYDGPELVVAHICPGGVFGWSAALGRDEYTSGAVAMTEGTALRVNGKELLCFCQRNPEIGAVLLDRMADVIAERLSNTHSQVLQMLSQRIDTESECWKRLNHDD